MQTGNVNRRRSGHVFFLLMSEELQLLCELYTMQTPAERFQAPGGWVHRKQGREQEGQLPKIFRYRRQAKDGKRHSKEL